MNYGIKNVDGQPHVSTIKEILRLASDHGVSLLDTAYVYGEAESVLGMLVGETNKFNVVTKTLPVSDDNVSAPNVRKVVESFHGSLKKLGTERVYGLLVHHSKNILQIGGERLWESLQELKRLSFVSKLGVSVYDPDELEEILSRYRIDIVQLPFNIYDQRFSRSGMLKACKDIGIEIHSRSAFLQGLLLMDLDRLPERFARIKEHHEQLLHEIEYLGFGPLEVCLKFVFYQPNIDRTIVGCETLTQFKQIIAALKNMKFDAAPFEKYYVEDKRIINPSLWY